MRCVIAALILCLASPAYAKPTRYAVPAPEFNGDRWIRVAQPAGSATDVTRHLAAKPRKAHQRVPKGQRRPAPVPRPGSTAPLAGIVAPLAVKAREIVAACGSKVISGIRHTRIAGTGGRLSLHASGRAVDIKGSPACIYSHLHGWPGGYSTDYGRVQHVHISYAPGGPEWGVRFAHYRGGKRHRHKHRRRA